MPIFDFQTPMDVTAGRLKEGLLALEELVPIGYAREIEQALDFREDRMQHYLDADIAATFSDPDVQDSVRACSFTLPLTRKVVEKKAMLYRREPLRRLRALEGEGERGASAAERVYAEIAFQGRLSETLRQALELAHLLRLAFVQVGVSRDRIVFDALTGKDVLLAPPRDGRPGDLTSYEAVVLPKPYRIDERRVYAFWSAQFHFLFDEEGRIVDDFGDPALANPFGIIPLVRIDHTPSSELYPLPAESLVAANRRLNFAVTELFYTTRFQSFGQPVFVSDDDVRPDFKVGVQHLVHVVKRDAAAAGDFHFESPAAPIGETKDSILDFLRLAARMHDVSPQSVDVSAVVESGVARRLAERDAFESRQRDVELCRLAEDRVFELVGALSRYYAAAGGGPREKLGEKLSLIDPEHFGLLVDFPEEEPTLDPGERLDLQERELSLGIKSPVDVYRERNPDAASWSEERVLEVIARNRAMSRELAR